MAHTITAEVTINLVKQVEKTDDHETFERNYRFTMPVGASFEEAIIFAKEMVAQVGIMQQKAKDLEAKQQAEMGNNKEEEK